MGSSFELSVPPADPEQHTPLLLGSAEAVLRCINEGLLNEHIQTLRAALAGARGVSAGEPLSSGEQKREQCVVRAEFAAMRPTRVWGIGPVLLPLLQTRHSLRIHQLWLHWLRQAAPTTPAGTRATSPRCDELFPHGLDG